MNTDRWNRIKEIFHATLVQEPEEREAFLDEVCRNDQNLRKEVEVLISSYDDSDRFMELPSGAGLLSKGRDRELSATRIGQYLIQEAISSGGMGTVYKALQENPKRAVAVKVMREGIASRSALRRFEYESQILARLTHPNIAQVIEAGTHPEGGRDKSGGLPYFVMEYIPEARSVTDYSREKGLALSDRLVLFLQVCDAVHHGHQKGIIHRDLKPSNILVNASGQVKIIDFGVARATDSDLMITTAQTDVGKLIGTVQYMSPEQCTADPNDIDTRSDVYALGVVLYELLCDELPYDVRNAAVFEATRVIRERDPQRPSTTKRALKGDMETIVLKALEKDRGRRYQTVAAFGTDIRRYLDGDVILAKPAGPVTRTLKRIKRNPVWSTAVVMALASLVVFMGYVLFVSNPQLKRERDAAEKEKQKAVAAEGKAVEALKDTKREANVNRAINDYLKEMLSSPNPTIDGREVRVVQVLDKAAAEIDEAFTDQPEIEAALRQTIGWTYYSLGQLDDAEPQLRKALEISRRAYGEEYTITLRITVDLAHVLYQTGQLSEAESMLRRSTGIMDRLWGNENPDTLHSMSMLGTILQAKGELDEAESILRGTLEIQRRIQGEDHKNTIYTRNMLATVLAKQGQYAEAETIYRDMLTTQRQKLGEEDWATLNSMAGLANTLCMQDKLTECEGVYRQVMEGRSRVMGEDHPITFQSMGNLAAVLCRQFRFSDAEALYREALDGCLLNLGENRPITVGIMDGLACVLSYGGKFAESERLFRKVERAYQRYLGRENPKTLKSMTGLAKVLGEQEKFTEALSLMEEVLEIQRRTLGEEDPDVLSTKASLGFLLLEQDSFFEAERLFRELVEIDQSRLDEGHPKLLDDALGLARSLTGQLKLSEAESLFRLTLKTAKAHYREGHLGIPTLCYHYGECLLKMKHYDRAEKHLLKGHEGFLSIYGENHKNTWLARESLVELYDSWGRPEKASGWRGMRIQ